MGNKMCRSCRRPVEDRLTRPQRLLRQPSDVDYKKLRKLILSEKLAPCFDAVDDPQLAGDLEECPICFFHYPSLNRSRCCAKGICTECFLQMKPSNTTRPAQCPFCKTSCYAVEYRGARTEEEKGLEQAEEQKVIEAKMRMQSESQIEEQVMHVDQPQSLLELLHPLSDVEGSSSGQGEGRDITELGGTVVQESIEVDGSSDPNTCSTRSPETHERHGELDVDLEEIMVMEAIWQSLQDSRLQRSESSQIRSRSHGENSTGTSFLSGDQRENSSSFSLPEGVAVAIARLAEHNITQQQVSEPDCETSQTDRNLYENFVRDSKSMQPEAGCSSNSGLSIIEQPCMLATELNA